MTTDTALTPAPEHGGALQPAPQARDLIALAIEHGAPVESLERLMAIRRELRAEQAEEAFFAALAAFQAECPPVGRNRAVTEKPEKGGRVRYRFADLPTIQVHIAPYLQRNGLSYDLDADTITKETGQVHMDCKCTGHHVSGHSATKHFEVPVDPKAYMAEPQKYASARSFGQRYALRDLFGIKIAGDDDDANSTGPEGGAVAEAPATADGPACPRCGVVGSIIKGKAEFGGGWLCWKKKKGCGAKFETDPASVVSREDLGEQVGEAFKGGVRISDDVLHPITATDALAPPPTDNAHDLYERLGLLSKPLGKMPGAMARFAKAHADLQGLPTKDYTEANLVSVRAWIEAREAYEAVVYSHGLPGPLYKVFKERFPEFSWEERMTRQTADGIVAWCKEQLKEGA